jgi:hypothetical protein
MPPMDILSNLPRTFMLAGVVLLGALALRSGYLAMREESPIRRQRLLRLGGSAFVNAVVVGLLLAGYLKSTLGWLVVLTIVSASLWVMKSGPRQ